MDNFEQILQNLEKMPKEEKPNLIDAERAQCMFSFTRDWVMLHKKGQRGLESCSAIVA